MPEQEDLIEQAIAWHVRLAEASAAEWSEFITWLETSPVHSETYDLVAEQDRMLGEAPRLAVSAMPAGENDNEAPPRKWPWALAGSGLAAAGLAMLSLNQIMPRPSLYEVATAPGTSRVITLADSTVIELSGGTRLRLDHANVRVAELMDGEALFHVRHDAANPFIVRSGAVTLRDVGTIFDVTRAADRILIAVSQGAVRFQSLDRPAILGRGEALAVSANGTRPIRSEVPPESVGGWRTGMLSFDDQPMRDVVATLNRLYAFNILLSDTLSDRPFTGMIRLTGAADRDIPHVAALTGTKWRRDRGRWILSDTSSKVP